MTSTAVGNKSVLSYATKFVAICYSSDRNAQSYYGVKGGILGAKINEKKTKLKGVLLKW